MTTHVTTTIGSNDAEEQKQSLAEIDVMNPQSLSLQRPVPQRRPPPSTTAAKSSSTKRKKNEKDINAPKRNISAYLHYQNAMRDQFKRENPGMTFTELRQHTSIMYSQLTPSHKEQWIERARVDRQRYLTELASYVPPPGFDAKGNATRRDVNAPKKNVSVYFHYQNAKRLEFQRENPGLTPSQLTKYTSGMYRNMTKEERAVWVQAAEKDRLRYEEQIANYKPSPGYDSTGNLLEDPVNKPQKKNKRKRSKESKQSNLNPPLITNDESLTEDTVSHTLEDFSLAEQKMSEIDDYHNFDNFNLITKTMPPLPQCHAESLNQIPSEIPSEPFSAEDNSWYNDLW